MVIQHKTVAGKGFGQIKSFELKMEFCAKMKNGRALRITIEHWGEGFETISKFDERSVQEH